MDGCHTGTLAMQPSTDMHQTGRISSTEDLRAGIQYAAHFVAEHGERGINVLDGEGTPKTAALAGVGQFYQVDSFDIAQQLQGRVTYVQHTQAVTSGVIRHTVRVVSLNIADTQVFDQEL